MYSIFCFFVAINIYHCKSKADNTLSRKDKFVNIIKENLRRNNDDYNEIINRNQMSVSNITSLHMTITKNFSSNQENITTKRRNSNNIKINSNNRRANNDPNWEYEYNDKFNKYSTKTMEATSERVTDFVHTATLDSKVGLKNAYQRASLGHVKLNPNRLNNYNDIKLPAIKALYNETPNSLLKFNKIPKFMDKKKIERFDKFMKKNKHLIKDFVTTELNTQTHKTLFYNSKQDDRLKQNPLRNELKNDEVNGDYEEGKLPRPELLDMAAAKGGRIHRLRIKGRLCQRHILLPEGPKYDSKGRWYVAAPHILKRQHFDSTPRPKVILPRCCNCCKKSVLGCE